MSLQTNQINDQFQSQLGRPATDYEVSKYSTASPQVLASLKDIYGKLNTNQSVSDYLTSLGKDSSLQAREVLGQQYGITNVGTSEGNIALMNAIKGGTPSSTPASVPGTIVQPDVVKPSSYSTSDTSQAANEWRTQQSGVGGSVSGATGQDQTQTDSNQPPVNPDISTTKTAYTQAQQSVIDVTKRIDDINKSIDSAMANKRDEIARSGGVVDESQLRSLVLTESAPLLAERKDLLSQRNQLVGEQNIAGKAYQDAVNTQKQSDVNYFKQKTLDINQTKLTDQEQQFADKLDASGWKMAKVNVLDSAGNVVGQKLTWTQNPATVSSDNAASTTKTSSGSGGISSTGVTNLGNITVTTPPKVTIADGAAPEQVLQSLITGPAVVYKGSTIPVSQQTLYNLAIADLMGSTSTAGGRTPSALIPLVKGKETDIMNAYNLTPVDIATAKAQFKNLSATNAKLLERSSFTNLAANIAKDNLDLVIESSKNVPRGGAKIVNKVAQWLQGNYTPAGSLAELETYIYTYAREYAKVTSGSAQSIAGLTESATREAEKLLSAAQAPETLATVAKAMGKDMQNVINENNNAVNQFPDSVKKLYGFAGGATSDNTKPQTVKSNGQEYNVGQVYNDGTSNWVIDAQGNWTTQK